MTPMATGHDAAATHDAHDAHDDHGHGHADDHHDHGHGHDAHDDHGHADAGGWVLIPLLAGLVIGLVLAFVFGLDPDAVPLV